MLDDLQVHPGRAGDARREVPQVVQPHRRQIQLVDPRDWSRPGVPHIVDVILTRTRPGAIILDHDGGGNRQQTLDALTIALPRLLDAGYRLTQP